MNISNKKLAGIGIIISLILGVPAFLIERPTVNIFLANDQNLPTFLIPDDTDPRYPYIGHAQIWMKNIGKLQANFHVGIASKNALVSFDKKMWNSIEVIPFSLDPANDEIPYKIYVMPDFSANNFTLALIVKNDIPIYQQFNLVNEQTATYHKNLDGTWEWSK